MFLAERDVVYAVASLPLACACQPVLPWPLLSIAEVPSMNHIFALVDCNNFYVSCERLFSASIQNKPVIVLSNNDGCVVARSNEVKALEVKMGQPIFEIRELIEKHNIVLFSSNY